MDWKKIIYDYKPENEQEKKDKDVFVYSLDHFDDILTRENPIVHLTSSAFVVNPSFDHALMVHHNIYNSWSWTGGHVDGETDFLKVAVKEAWEETGVTIKPVDDKPLSLDVLPVIHHVKRGVYVSDHLHLSIAYGAIGDEGEQTEVNTKENSGVQWIPIDQVERYSTEEHMKGLYRKLIDRILQYKR